MNDCPHCHSPDDRDRSLWRAAHRLHWVQPLGLAGRHHLLGAQRLGGYLFLGMLAFTVDLTWPLDSTFVLPFSAFAAAAIRVSALSVSAARRASCVALRWLARRLISLALFVLSQQRGSDPDHQLMRSFATMEKSTRSTPVRAPCRWRPPTLGPRNRSCRVACLSRESKS